MTALLQPDCTTVYISWGRWVARCPMDGCPQAEHYGADPDSGVVGRLTQAMFACGHCGFICRAIWPEPQVAADVVALLGMRPVPATRSWLPGEDPGTLLGENVAHRLLDEEDLLPLEWTPGDTITVMRDGVLAPHVRELVTERAMLVLAATPRASASLRAPELLAIGA